MLSPLLLHPLPPDQLITPQNRSSSEPADSIAISPHLISLLRSHVLLLHSSLSLSPIYPPLPHSSYFFFLCRCPFFLPPSLILYGCLSLSLSLYFFTQMRSHHQTQTHPLVLCLMFVCVNTAAASSSRFGLRQRWLCQGSIRFPTTWNSDQTTVVSKVIAELDVQC